MSTTQLINLPNMNLSDSEKELIKRAEDNVTKNTATPEEYLLIKMVDTYIQDLSYEFFEECKNNDLFSEGIKKFEKLSEALIECTTYLQYRNNSVYEAMETVYDYAEAVIWGKTTDKGHKKSLKDVFIGVCEELELNKEYSAKDIKDRIEDCYYDASGYTTYMAMLVNMGFIKRTRPGYYERLI